MIAPDSLASQGDQEPRHAWLHHGERAAPIRDEADHDPLAAPLAGAFGVSLAVPGVLSQLRAETGPLKVHRLKASLTLYQG